MRLRNLLTAFCLLLGCSAGSLVNADFIVAMASQDNTLYEDATGSLSNGAGTGLFAGRTNQTQGSIRRGMIQFDLSAIPVGSTINSATLRLTQNRTPSTTATTISVHRVTNSWGEGTSNANQGGTGPRDGDGIAATPGSVTWLHRFSPGTTWNNAGGDYVLTASATNSAITVNAAYDWSSAGLLADVQQWVNNPSSNFGWILVGDESTVFNARRFATREAGVGVPQLMIDFVAVPEPTAGWLLLLGIGSLRARRRRT